jgi:hypothetical protein
VWHLMLRGGGLVLEVDAGRGPSRGALRINEHRPYAENRRSALCERRKGWVTPVGAAGETGSMGAFGEIDLRSARSGFGEGAD